MQGEGSPASKTSVNMDKKKDKAVISGSKSIKHITSIQSNVPIIVRVIRLFKVQKKGCPGQFTSCEFIVIDEEGYKIQCVIKDSLISTFRHVEEGKCYEISNYGISFNTAKFKFVNHKYKIVFYLETIAKYRPDLISLSRWGFNFVDFQRINNNSLDEKFLIDVIGVMVGIGEIVPWKCTKEHSKSTKKEGRRLKIELMDLSKNVISCTFWDDFIDDFIPYLGCTSKDVIVVLVQFGKFGNFNGPHVSNGYDGTRVVIDDDSIFEIFDFKERFQKLEGESGVTLSYISSEVTKTASEVFLNVSEHKTLKDVTEELTDTKQVFKAVVLATIDHIDEKNGWYYNSCRNCKCKATEEENNKFWCGRCKTYEEYTVPRFFIHATIADASGTTCEATIFDNTAKKFLHKSASEIIDGLDRDADYKLIPTEVNELLNKTMLFHLNITEYNIKQLPMITAFTVLSMNDDISLIDEFERIAEAKEKSKISFDCSKDSSSDTPHKRRHGIIEVDEEIDLSVDEFSTTKKKIKEEDDED